jgi:hypothetical protein
VTCPSCNDSFALTWRLYVKSGRGRFSCPLCGVRLRGRHRWFYWVLMPGIAIATMASAILLTSPYLGIPGSGLMGLVVGLLVVLSCDRYLESKFGVLVVDS